MISCFIFQGLAELIQWPDARKKSCPDGMHGMQALSMRNVHEAEDEIDDAAEEARAAQERRAKEAAKVGKAPKPLDEGGGMWVSQPLPHFTLDASTPVCSQS